MLPARSSQRRSKFNLPQLRELKAGSPDTFRRALRYFEETLIPTVADDGSDPMAEWLEYGRVLASLSPPGRTVQIDASGRARDYARPVPPRGDGAAPAGERLAAGAGAGHPPEATPHQRAAYDLLVKQAQG